MDARLNQYASVVEVESAVLAAEGGEFILVLLQVFLNDDVDQYVDDFSQLFDILSKPVYFFQDILVIRQSIPPLPERLIALHEYISSVSDFEVSIVISYFPCLSAFATFAVELLALHVQRLST